MEKNQNYKTVFTVVEGKDEKEHWVRLGVAFTNRDDSLTVYLDAVPTNGKLVIRESQFPKRQGGGMVRFHGAEGVGGARDGRRVNGGR